MTDDEMDMMPPAIRRGTQRHFFDGPGRADDAAVLAKLEVDYTPAAVAVQLVIPVVEYVVQRPRVLIPSCGSGGWARAVRAVCEGCYIVGVEPRESEAANVAAACDEAFTGSIAAFMATKPEPFDLIIDNTPFSAFADFWPLMFLEAGLLRDGGTLGMYGLTQWGQGAKAIENLKRWSPSEQYRVGGRIEHRGEGTQRLAKIPKKRQVPGGPTHEMRDNGGDSREYCLWVWRMDDRHLTRNVSRPSWNVEQLPELPTAMRRWSPSAVPGTFPIDPTLVADIRARYL